MARNGQFHIPFTNLRCCEFAQSAMRKDDEMNQQNEGNMMNNSVIMKTNESMAMHRKITMNANKQMKELLDANENLKSANAQMHNEMKELKKSMQQLIDAQNTKKKSDISELQQLK
eukprot:1007628_1